MKSVIPKQTDYELLNGEGHWLPSFFSTLGPPGANRATLIRLKMSNVWRIVSRALWAIQIHCLWDLSDMLAFCDGNEVVNIAGVKYSVHK